MSMDINSVIGKIMTILSGGGSTLLALLFLFIFLIQFALVFLLYKSNRQSNIKIADLESLVGVTADRVLEIKKKTDAVTYQEVVRRLKSGQKPNEIADSVNVDINELEALQRLLKSTQHRSE